MSHIAFDAILYFSLDEEMFPSSDKSAEASEGIYSADTIVYKCRVASCFHHN